MEVSQEAEWLLEGLLEKKPQKRLGSQDSCLAVLKTAAFFKGVDWVMVKRRRIHSKLGLLFQQQADKRAENLKEMDLSVQIESENNSCCSAQEKIEGDCSESSLRLEDFTEECQTNQTLVFV